MIAEVPFPNESDFEEWSTTIVEPGIADSDPCAVGKHNCLHLSEDLGAKTIIEFSFEYIKEAIASEDWKVRQAGYYFLGYMADECKEQFEADLDNIMDMMLSAANDEHP